jgi:hypothetical protein
MTVKPVTLNLLNDTDPNVPGTTGRYICHSSHLRTSTLVVGSVVAGSVLLNDTISTLVLLEARRYKMELSGLMSFWTWSIVWYSKKHNGSKTGLSSSSGVRGMRGGEMYHTRPVTGRSNPYCCTPLSESFRIKMELIQKCQHSAYVSEIFCESVQILCG